VGSKGDSYDNALAETVNALYKAELINRQGPWQSVDEVGLATASSVHFWNTDRLHSACGDIPPAESSPPPPWLGWRSRATSLRVSWFPRDPRCVV
jgi:transposase InsO family protein